MIHKRLDVLYRIRNAIPHSWGEQGLLYSVKNRLYLLPNLADPHPVCVGIIPWRAHQYVCKIRLVDRALKMSIIQAYDAGDQGFIVCNGHSWWSIKTGSPAEPIRPFSKSRPMNRGICTSATGVTYIAEYLPNVQRSDPIRVFATKDLHSFKTAWEFAPGEVRHIHALITDPEERTRIWVLTGDDDAECRFHYTDDDFLTLHLFRADGQKTRATDMTICDGKLIWGMDSPDESCLLLSIRKSSPREATMLFSLPGPVYYMTRNEAGAIYFGTTIELGPAIMDEWGRIFGSRPEGGWEEIIRRRKDPFPQHGIFTFPRGVLPSNYLVYSQRALIPQEGQMTIARDNAWTHNEALAMSPACK